MPKASTINRNARNGLTQHAEPLQEEEEETQAEGEARSGKGGLNPYMLRLTPEMIAAPHPIELKRGGTVDSFEFALAKLDALIVKPLGFATEEAWLIFARQLFPYRQRQEELRAEEHVRKILDGLKDNPLMLQRVAHLAAQLSAASLTSIRQDGITPIPTQSFAPEDYAQPSPLEMARFS